MKPLEMKIYRIDGKEAATFTARDIPFFIELQASIYNGYVFTYFSYPADFDSLQQKLIREHIFKSIKWLPEQGLKTTAANVNNNTSKLQTTNTTTTTIPKTTVDKIIAGENSRIKNVTT
jgi:hypothetical protein